MSIEQYPSANGVLTSLIWRKTAVGGETSLSGYDNASQALSYTPGQEQVYLNGILLVRGSDYTATNGTSITGLTALVVDDFIQINCYNNFSVASVPTASLTGTVTNAQLANSSITINGSAVALGGSVSLAGDIESVTASTGLSGGGNTGALTLTNTMATAIDAKGDLIVGTAADTFSKLGVGANGTILTAASGEATGLSWAAPAPSGGMTLISETIASELTGLSLSSIPQTHKQLMLVWEGVYLTGQPLFGTRFNNQTTVNDPYFDPYAVSIAGHRGDGQTFTNIGEYGDISYANNYNSIFGYNANTSTQYMNHARGYLIIDNYSSTSKFKHYWANWSFFFPNYSAGSQQWTIGVQGVFKSNTAVSSIDIVRSGSSGSFSNAANTSIRLYGIS